MSRDTASFIFPATAALLAAGTAYLGYQHLQAPTEPPSAPATPEAEDGPKAAPTAPPLVKPDEIRGEVRVSKILVHPIKSCRGIAVSEARYTPIGLEYDRKWTVIDATTNKILTAREVAKLVRIHPTIARDEASPTGGVLRVSFPDDPDCEAFEVPLEPTAETLESWDRVDTSLFHLTGLDSYICQSASAPSPSAQLSRFLARPAHLTFKGPRPRLYDAPALYPALSGPLVFQDGYPLLVASTESLAAVAARTRALVGVQGVGAEWATKAFPIERFRPNIVLEGAGVPFAEDAWAEIGIGAGDGTAAGAGVGAPESIYLVSKCTRCLLPNVDPATGVRDRAVPFKVLMKFRTNVDPLAANKACFGVNGVPTGDGVVKVGDSVTVRKWIEDPDSEVVGGGAAV